MFFSLQSCQEVTTAPTSVVPTKSVPNAHLSIEELDLLVRELAVSFNNSELQKYLQKATLSSDKNEKILDAKSFLEEEIIFESGVKTSFKNELISNIEKDNSLSKTDGTTKIKVEFSIGENDDVVGTNSYIKLWGDPIYTNRNQKPSKGGMTDGIGDAYFSV